MQGRRGFSAGCSGPVRRPAPAWLRACRSRRQSGSRPPCRGCRLMPDAACAFRPEDGLSGWHVRHSAPGPAAGARRTCAGRRPGAVFNDRRPGEQRPLCGKSGRNRPQERFTIEKRPNARRQHSAARPELSGKNRGVCAKRQAVWCETQRLSHGKGSRACAARTPKAREAGTCRAGGGHAILKSAGTTFWHVFRIAFCHHACQ